MSGFHATQRTQESTQQTQWTQSDATTTTQR